MSEKRKVEGYVEHIIFRNEENGYTVLNLSMKGRELTCVGTLPMIGEGELIELPEIILNMLLMESSSALNPMRRSSTGFCCIGAVSRFRCDQRSRCGAGGKNCAPLR